MAWLRSLVAVFLLASVPQLGHSRALTPFSRCNGAYCDNWALDNFPTNSQPHFGAPQNSRFHDFTPHWPPPEQKRDSIQHPRAAPVKPFEPEQNSLGTKPTDSDRQSTNLGSNQFREVSSEGGSNGWSASASNTYEEIDPTKPKASDYSNPNSSPLARSEPDNTPPNLLPRGYKHSGTKSSHSTAKSTLATEKSAHSTSKSPLATESSQSTTKSSHLATLATKSSHSTTKSSHLATDSSTAPKASGCGLKRTNECGEDLLAVARAKYPGGLLTNELQNLQNRIDHPVKDDPIRTTEIDKKYDYKCQGRGCKEGNVLKIYPTFGDLLKKASVSLNDPAGWKQVISPKGRKGEDKKILAISWSGDQKLLIFDWSYVELDTTDMSPKPKASELTMAMLQESNVDPKKISAIGRSSILNPTTTETIDSIFKSFGIKKNPDESAPLIEISRSEINHDQTKKDAWNAYFMTDNGKATINLLAYHAEEWGYRSPEKLVLEMATKQNGDRYNSLVTIEKPT